MPDIKERELMTQKKERFLYKARSDPSIKTSPILLLEAVDGRVRQEWFLKGLLRHTSLRLKRLPSHRIQSLSQLANPLPTKEIHFRKHDVDADEEDSQLCHDQLDVQFHETKTGSAVEGSPGLD